MISDKANTCSAFHAQNSTNLSVTIPNSDAGPGTYAVANTASGPATPSQSEVDFNAVDPSCADKVAQPATSGTVTIKDVMINLTGPGDSIVSGTIDATFAGGHLTGDFDAVLCPDAPAANGGSEANGGSDSTQTCMP
jgi:hypothetical protein